MTTAMEYQQGDLFGLPSGIETLAERVQGLYLEIQDLYKRYRLPWVVGLSGGKDSTTATQLVWCALERLPVEERRYPVFVVGGDTLVEDPAMAARLTLSLDRITEASRRHGMNFSGHLVRPALSQRYFVNLIGRGYPAPTSHFRWCTDRLKVAPASAFIEERVSQFHEVILVLGAREQESTTRAQTMRAYEIPGQLLRRHSTLPNAWIYAPIAKWGMQEVWTYLLNNQSPWGDSNRELRVLYKQGEGECPLVVDSSTPTCGGGRYGCWTCTVSTHNRSIEARYEEGEDWLKPLLDFRELLQTTIDPARKLEFRDVRQRRTNRINLTRRGEVSPRSYTLETRRMLLHRLLEAQVQVQSEGPDPALQLISLEELREIRRIWITEDGDWGDSVCAIYRKVIGDEVSWDLSLLPFRGLSGLVKQSLEEAATRHDVPPALLLQLMQAEHEHGEAEGAMRALDTILSKDWRAPEEVVEALKSERASEPTLLPQDLW
jgi:DNA sulfur modification protein DndC